MNTKKNEERIMENLFDGYDHILKQSEAFCLHCGGGAPAAPVIWNTQTQLIRHTHCEKMLIHAGVFSYIPSQFYDGEDEKIF
jgi:hypothetical protein